LRRFCRAFVEARAHDLKIVNLYKNSTNVKNENLEDLPEIQCNFEYFNKNSQYFYFQNKTVKVTKNEIVEIKENAPDIFKGKIIPYDFSKLEPDFEWKIIKEPFDILIGVKSTKSHYLRYLINTSRVHWRKEMEQRTTGNEAEDRQYFKQNQFELKGSRLTEAEQREQLLNFSSKCFSIGYLLHKYKSRTKAWFLWCMENEIATKDNKKGGGTGKSFTFQQALFPLFNIAQKSGASSKKVSENRFYLDKISENTDIFLVDDCDKYFEIDYFKSYITGDIDVEKKTRDTATVEYEKSPKFVFTSNFPLRDDTGFLTRRVQYMIFSDWYHTKVNGSDYRENRSIFDDFGYEICTKEYKEEYWNEDFNFFMNCLQFYLELSEFNYKLEPPMSKVFERMNLAQIGEQFFEWAENFFTDENKNINTEIIKANALNAFRTDCGIAVSGRGSISNNAFTRNIKKFCEIKGYRYNPEEFCDTYDGKGNKNRIRDNEGNDCIYIQVPDK
jgi:hypothetical protein